MKMKAKARGSKRVWVCRLIHMLVKMLLNESNISLETELANLKLPSCLYNASGPRSNTTEELQIIGVSDSGAILSRSVTIEKDLGNMKPRNIKGIDLGGLCHGSFNSEGLPNEGIRYYVDKHWLTTVSSYKKPYMVSVAGKSIKEYTDLVSMLLEIDEVSAIEINISCQYCPVMPIIGYDYQTLEALLISISNLPGIANSGADLGKKPLGLKLPPYIDVFQCRQMAELIAKGPIDFVVSCSSAGNTLFVDTINECTKIRASDGLGCIGGGFIKPIALANVRELHAIFSELQVNIDIVGVGGVSTGQDAFELILCGATAVQVGTCFWEEGPSCFTRIGSELKHLMSQKGYSSIKEFRGCLKSFVQIPKNAVENQESISMSDTGSKWMNSISKLYSSSIVSNENAISPLLSIPRDIAEVMTYMLCGILAVFAARVILIVLTAMTLYVGLPIALSLLSLTIAVGAKYIIDRGNWPIAALTLLFSYSALAMSMMFACTLFLFSLGFPALIVADLDA